MDVMQELEDFIPDMTEGEGEVAAKEEEFSLDGLLAESLRAVEQEKGAKEARKRLARGNLEGKEREEIEATVRKWELARVWTARASVIMFEVQHCACGCSHRHFSGYFQRQTHNTSSIERWQKLDSAQVAASPLPKEVKENVTEVLVCHSCCNQQGWGE